MEFIAPIMLLGAIGIAIPVVIHLIGRRRATVVRFAALDYLLGSNRKVARRLRLRELLLLLTRILVCFAVPLALAKPFSTCTAAGPLVERGPQAAVLVIDDSFAMSYDFRGETLLSQAKRHAASILEQLGPEAEVSVVLAAEGADPPAELTRDHVRLRERIDEIEATWRPADLTTALRRSAQLLSSSAHERRTVFLLSVLAATSLHPQNPPWPAGTGPDITIVPLADDSRLDNLAVTALEVEPDASTGSRGIRVTAEVGNFGATPVREHGIGLRVGTQVVARGTISLGPGERTRKRFLASLPQDARSANIIVEIDHDALAVDDRRFVRAQLREEVRVLLVNGDPHTDRHEDELFYLEAALRPGDRGDTGVSLTTVTVDELPVVPLSDFDVVVLANVRALPAERVAVLANWVRGGGGLLVAPGDNVNPDAYNRTMQPLLPQALHTVLDVSYGSRGAERAGRELRLTKFDVDHPVFSVFSQDAPGLRDARFSKIMLLGPTSQVDDRKVLARYTNGATAMVEARSGKGRLLLMTSSIDRDWNDLAIHPGYLPLVQQSIRYLARKESQLGRASVMVGSSAVLRVRSDDKRLEITAPDGAVTVIEGETLEGRKFTRFAGTREPGIYRVVATDKTGETRVREEAAFAVNLDPRGSDLRPATPDSLPTSGHAAARTATTTHQRRVELWHAIAFGLLLLLLLESVLVLR